MHEKNHIKMINTFAIKINKDSEEKYLFIDSVLKYNCFVQFIILDKQTIITITDHMDIFIDCKSKTQIQYIKDIINKFDELCILQGRMCHTNSYRGQAETTEKVDVLDF